MKQVLLIYLMITSVACASAKKSILTSMAIGAGAGALYGTANTPNGENQLAHQLAWGGLVSAATGAIAAYVFDPDSEVDNYKKENEKLRIEVTKLREDPFYDYIDQNKKVSHSDLPDSVKKYFVGGAIQKKVSQWREEAETGNWIYVNRLLKPIKKGE
jgi:gas vesicle protein